MSMSIEHIAQTQIHSAFISMEVQFGCMDMDINTIDWNALSQNEKRKKKNHVKCALFLVFVHFSRAEILEIMDDIIGIVAGCGQCFARELHLHRR